MPRSHQKPGAASFIGSVVLHAAIGVAIWTSTVFAPAPQFFESYAIEIVSPPPTIEAAEMMPGTPEELVIEAPAEPAPEPPAPEPPAPEKPPAPRPEPPRENRPTTPPPPRPDSARAQPSAGPGAVASSPGGENLNIRMEGLRRDYPAYYERIVFQINRCFQRPSQGRWEAVVSFSVMRDGSVTDIRLATRSPNAAFNVLAMEAVECAGRPGRIGPLPADLPFDRLPIQFTFSPAGPGT